MNIEDVKKFITETDYALMLEAVEGVWCTSGRDWYWIGGDGDVYHSYQTEGVSENGEVVFVNLDGDMGYWITTVFVKSKQTSYEDFEDMYGDRM